MSTKQTELLELIDDLEAEKEKQAQRKGALKEVEKELKEKFGCKDFKEASRILSSLEDEIEELEDELTEAREALMEDVEEAGL